MPRALSLYLPCWSSDLARRRLRREEGRRPASTRAPGNLRENRNAACPLEPAAHPGDAAALEALALWSLRFTPLAAPDPPDGLLLDVTGCAPLHGGEKALLEELTRQVARLGFSCRAGIAPTFTCARALARAGPPHARVPEGGGGGGRGGEIRRALAPLPVRSLGLEQTTVEALAEVGIDRVGTLLRLPRHDLAARFGEALLLTLDRALGQAMEAITPVRPVTPPRREQEFAGPTRRLEIVGLAVQGLLESLAPELEQRGAGARRLDVTLARCDLPHVRLVLRLGRPSRDPKHLWSLVRPRLESVQLGFGVEGAAVEVPRLGMLPARQRLYPASGLGDERLENEQALGRLVDTLAARLGWERLQYFETLESYLPERAFQSRSLLENEGLRPKGLRPEGLRPKGLRPPGAAIAPACRPTALLHPPQPLEPGPAGADGLPGGFRRQGGGYHHVRTLLGPERIASEWWRGPAPAEEPTRWTVREYFLLQDVQGRWLWIYREGGRGGGGDWFLHGEWR